MLHSSLPDNRNQSRSADQVAIRILPHVHRILQIQFHFRIPSAEQILLLQTVLKPLSCENEQIDLLPVRQQGMLFSEKYIPAPVRYQMP